MACIFQTPAAHQQTLKPAETHCKQMSASSGMGSTAQLLVVPAQPQQEKKNTVKRMDATHTTATAQSAAIKADQKRNMSSTWFLAAGPPPPPPRAATPALTNCPKEVEGYEARLQVCCYGLSQLLRPHCKLVVAARWQLAPVLQTHNHDSLLEAGVGLHTHIE